MTLIEQIGKDFITAFKESKGNEAKKAEKDFLGLVKSTLTKDTKTPSDAEVIAGLKNMLKKHKESLAEFGKGTMTEGDIAVVERYIPAQMSEEKLREEISAVIAEKGLSGRQGMGPIMGHLKSNFGGQYDGKLASTIAQELL